MKSPKDIIDISHVTVSRQDIVEFEPYIKDSIREFLPFKSYSLYFPQSAPRLTRTWTAWFVARLPICLTSARCCCR